MSCAPVDTIRMPFKRSGMRTSMLNLALIEFTATIRTSLQADLLSCFAIYDPMSGTLLPMIHE